MFGALVYPQPVVALTLRRAGLPGRLTQSVSSLGRWPYGLAGVFWRTAVAGVLCVGLGSFARPAAAEEATCVPLSAEQMTTIAQQREDHLASTFRIDSLHRDLLGAVPFEVPDGCGMWPSPVPVEPLPDPSMFGNRVHPIFGTTRFHNGIDVRHEEGTPVQAIAAGTVVSADWTGGYGNTIAIDHGDGFSTISAHLAAFEVAVGDVVEPGDVIGLVGRTGRVTGPHLHFETRLGGVPVDPAWFIGGLIEPALVDHAPPLIDALLGRLAQPGPANPTQVLGDDQVSRVTSN